MQGNLLTYFNLKYFGPDTQWFITYKQHLVGYNGSVVKNIEEYSKLTHDKIKPQKIDKLMKKTQIHGT